MHTNLDCLESQLVFKKFDAEQFEDFIEFLKPIILNPVFDRKPTYLRATGGGAFKYSNYFKSEFDIDLVKEDEMACLISGLDFLTRNVPFESFSFSEKEQIVYDDMLSSSSMDHYPCLLVNIGSGVSIIKVTDQSHYERISGTSLGGGTFWGLMSLLSDCETFDDALQLADDGNNKSVDLLVGDIYGSDYNKIGLSSDVIASSFGKAFKYSPEKRASLKSALQGNCDMSRSLLYMLSNNIGQIAYLNAKLHQIQRIYFSGFFIRGHSITMKTLSYAIRFWSKGEMNPFFLRHEGYLGSLGCLVAPGSHLQNSILKDVSFELATKPPCKTTDTFSPSDNILILPAPE